MPVDGVPVVDADSHVYEPAAIWDRFVSEQHQRAARAAFFYTVDDAGVATAVLNGREAETMHTGAIVREAVWRPGTTVDDIGSLDPRQPAPLNPGAWDAAARLEDMDALGIDAAVVLPTLFNEYLPLVEDPQIAAVLAGAYNDWVTDLCSSAPDRLLPVAVLPLQDVELARRELARVANAGLTAVLLRPMFYAISVDDAGPGALDGMGGMGGEIGPELPEGFRPVFVDDPYYKELWDEVADRDLVACVHPSPGSTNPFGVSTGTFIEHVAAPLGIGHRVAETVASLQDTAIFLTAAFHHGLLEDYPRLRLALLHGAASMTPLTLEKSETYLWLGQGNAADVRAGKPVSLEPGDVFGEHPVIVSFPSWERSVGRLAAKVDAIGTKAAWGSRYPQHDASTPAAAIEMLREHLDSDAVHALMAGHAADLFGIDVHVGAST